MITLIRRYFSYNIVNSHSYEVSLELTMKITDDQKYLFFPIKNYTADLKVVDSNNTELIILSDKEFENKFDISMELMTDVYLTELKKYLGTNSKLTKDHRLIAIMLINGKKEYEKIKISWIETIGMTKSDGIISLNYEMPVYLLRYGKIGSSLYLSIKADPKYEILKDPTFEELQSHKSIEKRTIHNDKNHKIYRFDDVESPQLIQVVVKIGLPIAIKRWAYMGLIAGISLPIFIVTLTVIKKEAPPFTFETLAGVIGFLIGQKVFIFEDLTFMDNWNIVNISLAIFVALVLFGIMVASWNNWIVAPDYHLPSHSPSDLQKSNGTIVKSSQIIITKQSNDKKSNSSR